MSSRDPYLKMFLLEKTERAVHVSDAAGSRHVWLPRSLIAYSRLVQVEQPGKEPNFLFTLPEWKIEQANLWDFETNEN